MKPGELVDVVRGEGLDLMLSGDGLKLTGPQTAITPELVEAVRASKADLIALLRTLPAFSAEDEKDLVDYYVGRPRAERLAMHNAGKVYHARGWPWREADLQAMRDHCERNP